MRLSRLCDAIVVLIAIETAVVAPQLRAGRRIGALANALAGVSLVLALRSSLERARPARTLFWIAASLPAHAADLGARMRT